MSLKALNTSKMNYQTAENSFYAIVEIHINNCGRLPLGVLNNPTFFDPYLQLRILYVGQTRLLVNYGNPSLPNINCDRRQSALRPIPVLGEKWKM